jgi:rfaE bifunctional protein nucleotidyltransferase chain/domain
MMGTDQTYPYEWTAEGPESLDSLLALRRKYRAEGKRVVSTNGCFDLLHVGHVQLLRQARALGDLLVVGLNSDASVQRLKGPGHPLVPETERATLLLALRFVDRVLIFDDPLPNAWLSLVQPDIHCKSADYAPEAMPETVVVREHGGQVYILPLLPGHSTSRLIRQAAECLEKT